MKNIIIKFSVKADKQLRKLPEKVINKLEKQTDFLTEDMSHPSLRVKKKQGDQDVWEARIDYHYRFTLPFYFFGWRRANYNTFSRSA